MRAIDGGKDLLAGLGAATDTCGGVPGRVCGLGLRLDVTPRDGLRRTTAAVASVGSPASGLAWRSDIGPPSVLLVFIVSPAQGEFGQVVGVALVSQRDGFSVPLLPGAGLVASNQEDGLPSRVEREDQSDLCGSARPGP